MRSKGQIGARSSSTPCSSEASSAFILTKSGSNSFSSGPGHTSETGNAQIEVDVRVHARAGENAEQQWGLSCFGGREGYTPGSARRLAVQCSSTALEVAIEEHHIEALHALGVLELAAINGLLEARGHVMVSARVA